MSVEPRPVPNAPSAPYVQVCESPPAITEPGQDPALLAEQRVLDPASSLVVEGHALRVRPLLEPPLELGRARVLGGREVVRDHHHPPGSKTRRDAHPLHRPERDRAARRRSP